MAALSAPPRSHLDPDMMAILDDLRGQLCRVFRAGARATTLAVSGTGTSGLEAAVANLAEPGRRALVVVSGYFGDRLAQVLTRYGCDVSRLDVEWGRAVDPDAVRRALAERRADLVAVVHAETSTGVRNPVAEVAALAREYDALTIVD
ncbi:MAG TPA: aminotransferase class V-fold PLP-dependent enzyme, partial [Vicinamibacterales bacterium]